jgi:hypothetical protein
LQAQYGDLDRNDVIALIEYKWDRLPHAEKQAWGHTGREREWSPMMVFGEDNAQNGASAQATTAGYNW